MNTNQEKLNIYGINVDTIKKDIKNIHLGVYPPNGRVRVATPLKTTDETIKHIILTKMSWIKKQQRKFNEQDRQTKREYVSGESHYVMGKRYRLSVITTKSKQRIEIKNNRINLYVKQNTTLKKKQIIFENFYRKELQQQIPKLLKKWQNCTGIEVKEVRIKKMKTKWGSCIPEKKRIWINLELGKKPQHCLEYILVHELTHIKERNHTKKFRSLLTSFMPNWIQYKEELNRSKLAHFELNQKSSHV